jgi:hypothetical protein
MGKSRLTQVRVSKSRLRNLNNEKLAKIRRRLVLEPSEEHLESAIDPSKSSEKTKDRGARMTSL